MKEACGLFAVYGHPDAAWLTYRGLYAQQHRGQESAGICSVHHGRILREAGDGLVTDVFDKECLARLHGRMAIGHVRYSTAGACEPASVQPLLAEGAEGQIAVAHNGNLTNAGALRAELESQGAVFRSSSDTEVVLHLLARAEGGDAAERHDVALARLAGAYNFLILRPESITAVRDPFGFRPLCLGRLEGGAYVIASETCALEAVDAGYVREVAPGEMVTLSHGGLGSRRWWFGGLAVLQGGATLLEIAKPQAAQCVFELIYFADPASNVYGQNAHQFRVATGRRLAQEAPADGDLVIPIPNCAQCAAIGYSEESGVPLGRGFTTNPLAGRSFIMPTQDRRDLVVKSKFNVIREVIRGKRLVVVEDSVVRGTTTRAKLSVLRKAGAMEIHLRIASPPIRHPCYFGVDIPDTRQLVATGRSHEEIRGYLQVDSLAYLSIEGLMGCAKNGASSYCSGCFSGQYPVGARDVSADGATEGVASVLSHPRTGGIRL